MSSSLKTLILAFLGDNEAKTTAVADGLRVAVAVAAQHGTQQPLIDAVAFVATLKGTQAAYVAMREGMKATGLSVQADGKRVIAHGLNVGKMNQDKSAALADSMAESFTIAASTILNAPKEKTTRSAADKAAAAFKVLATLSDKEIGAAFTTTAGKDVLSALDRALSALKQADAAKKAKEAVRQAAGPVKAEKPVKADKVKVQADPVTA